jgi:hypothetical protein
VVVAMSAVGGGADGAIETAGGVVVDGAELVPCDFAWLQAATAIGNATRAASTTTRRPMRLESSRPAERAEPRGHASPARVILGVRAPWDPSFSS